MPSGGLRPPAGQPIVAAGGLPSISWGEFFQDIADFLSDQEARFVSIEADIVVVEADIAALETGLAALDAATLKLAGGTMTGPLVLSMVYPAVTLNRAAPGTNAVLASQTGGLARWTIVVADGQAEAGGNTGSDFTIDRHSDAGAYLDSPIAIDRATGIVLVAGTDHAARLASIEARLLAAGIP